jgi:hypothetical protein
MHKSSRYKNKSAARRRRDTSPLLDFYTVLFVRKVLLCSACTKRKVFIRKCSSEVFRKSYENQWIIVSEKYFQKNKKNR